MYQGELPGKCFGTKDITWWIVRELFSGVASKHFALVIIWGVPQCI